VPIEPARTPEKAVPRRNQLQGGPIPSSAKKSAPPLASEPKENATLEAGVEKEITKFIDSLGKPKSPQRHVPPPKLEGIVRADNRTSIEEAKAVTAQAETKASCRRISLLSRKSDGSCSFPAMVLFSFDCDLGSDLFFDAVSSDASKSSSSDVSAGYFSDASRAAYLSDASPSDKASEKESVSSPSLLEAQAKYLPESFEEEESEKQKLEKMFQGAEKPPFPLGAASHHKTLFDLLGQRDSEAEVASVSLGVKRPSCAEQTADNENSSRFSSFFRASSSSGGQEDLIDSCRSKSSFWSMVRNRLTGSSAGNCAEDRETLIELDAEVDVESLVRKSSPSSSVKASSPEEESRSSGVSSFLYRSVSKLSFGKLLPPEEVLSEFVEGVAHPSAAAAGLGEELDEEEVLTEFLGRVSPPVSPEKPKKKADVASLSMSKTHLEEVILSEAGACEIDVESGASFEPSTEPVSVKNPDLSPTRDSPGRTARKRANVLQQSNEMIGNSSSSSCKAVPETDEVISSKHIRIKDAPLNADRRRCFFYSKTQSVKSIVKNNSSSASTGSSVESPVRKPLPAVLEDGEESEETPEMVSLSETKEKPVRGRKRKDCFTQKQEASPEKVYRRYFRSATQLKCFAVKNNSDLVYCSK